MKKPKSSPIFDNKDFPVSFVRVSILRGTGTDIEEAKEKPIIGIANSQTDMNPGHMHLTEVARRVKDGVNAAGGLPFEFNVPAPCDGITEGHEAMRYVLAQRELIADTIETHTRSMGYDALVMIAGCDKIIPGMLMAAARLDMPVIFVTGGPNAWGIRWMAGKGESVDHKDYDDLGLKVGTSTCSTCGACEIMGTANTFQCMTEALGMCLPGTANIPGFLSEKLSVARKTGMRIVEMVEEELNSGKILTEKALHNAVVMDLAIGGSTNSTLHLPALAHEIGAELPWTLFNEYNVKIPTICAISPNGPHGMVDLHMAGGIGAAMKVMKDDLNLDCLSVTGQKLADALENLDVRDTNVIRSRENAYHKEGGTVALFGNLAPEGAVVKQSAVIPEMRTFTGKAFVLESEHDALAAFREGKVENGMVMVIRNEGPKGGPGMPETLAVTMALDLSGLKEVAMVTDGRFSGASYGPCVGQASPEAAAGGPIAAVKDGDEITIDIPNRSIKLHVDDAEIQKRLAEHKPQQRDVPSGYMRRYMKLVSSASKGAVLDAD